MKYHTRRDGNEKPLLAFMKRAGIWHQPVAQHLGLGCDVLLRHRDGYVVLGEIKDPSRPPSARKLTEAEEALRDAFPSFYRVLMTEEDVLEAVGLFSAPALRTSRP